MNDITTTEQLAGGALRVSFGQQAVPQPNTGAPALDLAQSRVYSGVTRHGTGQEPEQTGVTRYAVSHDGVEGGSVLATMARAGTAQTVELIPGQPWTRTSVAVALKEGVLVRGPGGVLQDARTADGQQKTAATQQAEQQATPQAQQQAAADELHGVFNQQEDAAFAAEMGTVDQHAYNSAIGAGIKDMVLGGDFASAAGRLVENGVEPGKAAEQVENARWYFQQITDRAVTKAGLNEAQREAFYADLRNQPGRLQNALQYLTRGRDVSHFQAYAREWLDQQQRRAAKG